MAYTSLNAYVDDVLIASGSPEEHEDHLRQVLQRFYDHGIVINPAKCKFGASELEFSRAQGAQAWHPPFGRVSCSSSKLSTPYNHSNSGL